MSLPTGYVTGKEFGLFCFCSCNFVHSWLRCSPRRVCCDVSVTFPGSSWQGFVLDNRIVAGLSRCLRVTMVNRFSRFSLVIMVHPLKALQLSVDLHTSMMDNTGNSWTLLPYYAVLGWKWVPHQISVRVRWRRPELGSVGVQHGNWASALTSGTWGLLWSWR